MPDSIYGNINAGQTFSLIASGASSINAEISNLQPSTPIHLYEIDLAEVFPQMRNFSQTGQPIASGILRIYNDYNLFKLTDNNHKYGTVFWQGNYYYPFPIYSEGFDVNSAGTLPTPTLVIANASPDQGTNSFYKYIRMQVESLGDIIGAKFTRIRTFLKYLHGNNFTGNINPFTNDTSIYEIELPRDIYYIERKVTENKYKLEYSLASVLDVENLKLPARTVLASKCSFQYRGEGCLYEYNKRITKAHSGIYGEVVDPGVNITLPLEAPPVATDNDELFLGTVFTGSAEKQRFSGIDYDLVGAGKYGNTNQWIFTNYTLNAGTPTSSAAGLNDGNTAVVAITKSGAGVGTIQLSLNTGAEINQIRLTANNTITNNYEVQFSPEKSNGAWMKVRDASGYDLSWNLNGQPAGTYYLRFPSRGIHTGWRLVTTTSTAGTQISELNFSGSYRVGDKGLWATGNAYQRGDFTYIEKNNIKYYYVSLTGQTGTVFNAPPNRLYWGSDNCSKSAYACRLRWLKNPYFRPVIWPVTRGGWTREGITQRYRITGAVYNLTTGNLILSSPYTYKNVFDAYNKSTNITSGGLDLENRWIWTKSSLTSAWDEQVYSSTTWALNTNGVYAEGKPRHATNRFMFGLNKPGSAGADVIASANWTGIDWAWYCNQGTLEIYVSGAQRVSNAGSYNTSTLLKVEGTTTAVNFYINGTLYTSYPQAQTSYCLDSSFYDPNASASLYFGVPNLTGYGGDFRGAIIPPWYNLEDASLWPRRADCHDPSSNYAHGLPEDYTGEYLNGFLPFGGFPGVEKTK